MSRVVWLWFFANTSPIQQWLQVSAVEWLVILQMNVFIFAMLNNYFSINLIVACDYALSCLHRNEFARPKTDESYENLKLAERISKLKNCALQLATFSLWYAFNYIFYYVMLNLQTSSTQFIIQIFGIELMFANRY
ncbi:hypothetical protein GQ457_16G012100 [Hibiscus cannabinus]